MLSCVTLQYFVTGSESKQEGQLIMESAKLSLICQLILLLYFEAVEWIDIFPWNDVRQGNGQAGLDIAIGVVMLGAIIATVRRYRLAMSIAVVLYAVWLWLQIDTWWLAYIRGASPGWQRTYKRFFSQTVQVLPRVGNHLPPDACHLILQVLVFLALATTVYSSVSLWRAQRLSTR